MPISLLKFSSTRLFPTLFATLLCTSCSRVSAPPANASTLDISFSTDMERPWVPLNDGVMGGMSEGAVTWQDSSFRWKGQTRLENNGGFASLRSPWGDQDLRGFQRLEVTCRGTGGPFKVTLETSQRWWMPYAYATLDVSEEWQTIEVDAKDFQWSQAQMGDLRTVDPQSEFQNILRMGWMKYDGTAQAFDLEVGQMRWIQ